MTNKKKTKKKAPRRRKRDVDAAALIAALEQHILGEREMTPTQVSAALALLKQIRAGKEGDVPALAHEDALEELE